MIATKINVIFPQVCFNLFPCFLIADNRIKNELIGIGNLWNSGKKVAVD